MTIPDEDLRPLVIATLLDHLSAIIDHANDAIDTAHNNDMPDDAVEMLDIKMQAWNMGKRLKMQMDKLDHAK